MGPAAPALAAPAGPPGRTPATCSHGRPGSPRAIRCARPASAGKSGPVPAAPTLPGSTRRRRRRPAPAAGDLLGLSCAPSYFTGWPVSVRILRTPASSTLLGSHLTEIVRSLPETSRMPGFSLMGAAIGSNSSIVASGVANSNSLVAPAGAAGAVVLAGAAWTAGAISKLTGDGILTCSPAISAAALWTEL